MYFSLPVERKVPKERHVREARPPLRNPPSPRDPFAIGVAKESDCAEGRGHPIPRTNGGAPSARKLPKTRRRKKKCLAHPREQVCPASSALRRGCGLPATRELPAHKAFLPPRQKGSAGQGIGSVRKGPGSFPYVAILLVLFFRHGKKSTQSHLPDKPKFE